jgi:hypothetical protein
VRDESAEEAINRYMSSVEEPQLLSERRDEVSRIPFVQASAGGVVRMMLGKNHLLLMDGVVVCDKNELMRP